MPVYDFTAVAELYGEGNYYKQPGKDDKKERRTDYIQKALCKALDISLFCGHECGVRIRNCGIFRVNGRIQASVTDILLHNRLP